MKEGKGYWFIEGKGYRFIENMNDELVGMSHPRYGRQLWSKGKLRKPAECFITKKSMAVGDTAFRPMTNLGNRMLRISMEGLDIITKCSTH